MMNIEDPGTDYENWYHHNDPENLPWCEWNTEMKSLLETTANAITINQINYAYFIAPGDVHTILMNNEVYTLTVNGVRFVDWLRNIVEGGPLFANVECTECQQPEFVSCP